MIPLRVGKPFDTCVALIATLNGENSSSFTSNYKPSKATIKSEFSHVAAFELLQQYLYISNSQSIIEKRFL